MTNFFERVPFKGKLLQVKIIGLWEERIIGNVNAGRVRIFKINSFKAFTDNENDIKNDKNKKMVDLLEEIHANTKIRNIDAKTLYDLDKDGNVDKSKGKERYQVPLFENDIVRLALQDRNETLDYQLLDEIIYMEIYHNDIMWQIIRDGIMIAGDEYRLFSATTGQVRHTTVTLIKKKFYEAHEGFLLVGLTREKINAKGGMNVGKFLAYTALPLSSSVLPEKEIYIDRCIVVKGLETVINGKVKYIDIQQDEAGQFFVADTPNDYVYIEDGIEIEHTDGAGMFLPGELPSSCQIRSGFFKGAMFPFDFRLFADDVANNNKIIDAWGNEVDIKEQDIRFIFTTSQLKMWKMYSSWDEYKQAFGENGLKITINSYANPPKEIVSFSYQYLQTLPYGCDIRKLCDPAKDDLKRLHSDFDYVIEQMGYADDTETDIDDNSNDEESEDTDSTKSMDFAQKDNTQSTSRNCNSIIAEALKIYPHLMYDSHIIEKIRKLAWSRKKSYKGGKIPVRGYYSYAAPDMYALCELLFCGNKNPEGLVPKNHVYNKYYDLKDNVEHLICLRSPHLSRYEYGKRDLIKSDKCRKWFKYMESDTVCSCHDLLSKTLQMDWDGDEILVSDDEELYELVKDLPDEPLYYKMQTAEPQQITDEAIRDTLIKGFDNNVIGESSIALTKLWNSPEATKDNPIPYDDAINVYCAYSNYAIDYPKTGKSLALGDYEKLYSDLVPPKDGASIFEEPKIKCPNFFIEAKGKQPNSVAKPTKNVMDRIKKYISTGTGHIEFTFLEQTEGKNDFDYRMLMNNEKGKNGKAKYEINRYDSKYEDLYCALSNRMARKRKICMEIDEERKKNNVDSTDVAGKYETFHYHCVQKFKEIFTDKRGTFNVDLAVNYLIDLEYMQHDFVSRSKDILWKCFGHIMLENLKRNLNSDIVIQARPRLAYRKAVSGDESINKAINEKLESRSVNITKADYEFIEDHLQKYKNGKPHSNDFELLFVLYSLYKEAKESNRLKDGYLLITKKKHTTKINDHNKRRKKKVGFNMNRIIEIAGAKSYTGTFNRLKESGDIEIIDNEKGKYYKIKFDIPETESDILITVGNVYNSMIYYDSYVKGKPVDRCKLCGKEFIKVKNTKTCGEECSKKLHNLNQAIVNETKRKTATQEESIAI